MSSKGSWLQTPTRQIGGVGAVILLLFVATIAASIWRYVKVEHGCQATLTHAHVVHDIQDAKEAVLDRALVVSQAALGGKAPSPATLAAFERRFSRSIRLSRAHVEAA